MKIAYFEESHLEECATIFTNHYNGDDFGCTFTTELSATYLKELQFRPRFVGFVLLKKDQVIGFAFCHLKTWSEADELQIDEFIMKDNFQRKGLGTKLLSFIYDYAKTLKLGGITTTTNVIALTDFYQKNDFLEHEITFLYKGISSNN